MLLRMAFLRSLSLCLLLFTTACLARSTELQDRFSQCQLDRLNSLEPDHRVESEAGITETWNPRHPELQCAGVSLIRRTIDPKGLHLPSYSPSPQLIFIISGKGVIGLSIPGCPQTYEEPRSSSSSSKQQQRRDSHQKIRHFYKGDVIAIPPGIPYWTYNHGDEPLVAISLLDTSNFVNQLDSTPRVFYIGGNPDVEFPETQEQQEGSHHHQEQRQSSPGGRRGGKHQQQEEEQEEEDEGGSVLSGFSSEFLSQALNLDKDIAKKLQSPRDERKQIVKVEDGLSFISPESQSEEDEDEEEEQQQPRRRHRGDEEEEEEEHGSRQRHRKEEEEEEDEDEEDEPRHSKERRRWWRKRREGRHGRGEEEVDEEEEEEEERRSSRGKNGLEETLCTLKIHENIARPSRADLYNPRAGRISTSNSLTLPILRFLRLGAEYVNLYKNGIYSPHWNINANSLLYVIRGRGRVQVVNCQGNSVFEEEMKKGQLVVVPQNFVVAEQAGEEGFEYVVFKTSDRASVSHVKQVFRATPAEVLANAFGLGQQQVSQIKFSGNRGPLVHPQQSHSSSRDRLIAKVA